MKRNSLALATLGALCALCGCVEKRLGPPQAKKPKLALSATPTAQPTPTPSYPQIRPLNERAPVQIHADRLRYDDKLKETIFSGHVVAVQDTTTLHADKLRSTSKGESAKAEGNVVLDDAVRKVQLKAAEGQYTDSLGEATLGGGVLLLSQDPYAIPVTVTGQTAWYRSLSRLARVEGGVKVFRGKLTATAETAELFGDEQKVVLNGDVVLSMGVSNTVHAASAILSGLNKNIQFEGKVEAKLIPAEVKQASAHPEQ